MELRTAGYKWKMRCFFVLCAIFCVFAEENTLKELKPRDRKIGKDVRDMTDADLERLLDQWEVRTYHFTVILIFYFLLHLHCLIKLEIFL